MFIIYDPNVYVNLTDPPLSAGNMNQVEQELVKQSKQDIELESSISDNAAKYLAHINDTADKHSASGVLDDSNYGTDNVATALNSAKAEIDTISTGDSNALIGVYSLPSVSGTNDYTATYGGLVPFATMKLLVTISNANTGDSTLTINGGTTYSIVDNVVTNYAGVF